MNPTKIFAISSNHTFYHNATVPGLGQVALVTPFSGTHVVQNNNADVLILDGKAPQALHKSKFFRHAHTLLLPLNLPSLVCFALAGSKYMLRGRLKPQGFCRIQAANGNHKWHLKLKPNLKKRYQSERCFPGEWSNKQFLSWLDTHNITYVVMRWYEDIIAEQNSNDIDLLMPNHDASKVRNLLQQQLGTKAVDVFDFGGGDIDKVAYFPPVIAKKLIETKQKPGNNLPGFVPAPEQLFNSLAYHAVLRKGVKSGLKTSPADPTHPTGKLYQKLNELNQQLNLHLKLDLVSLYHHLQQQNYLPPLDMLVKLKQENPWLQQNQHLFQKHYPSLKGHYFVLILRDIVEKWGNLTALQADIQQAGFTILHQQPIPPAQRDNVAQHIRGGNWNAGAAWPVDGGKPCHLVVVHSPNPLPMSRKLKKTHPAVNDARILFKRHWRNQINGLQGPQNAANFVHTSDNNAETLEYLEHIAPQIIPQILAFDANLPHAAPRHKKHPKKSA